MTRKCELPGKLPLSGNNKSHAENKTRRKFRPNLCNVTLISDTLGQSDSLKVCAQALKTVEHRGGLDAFLAKAKERARLRWLLEGSALGLDHLLPPVRNERRAYAPRAPFRFTRLPAH